MAEPNGPLPSRLTLECSHTVRQSYGGRGFESPTLKIKKKSRYSREFFYLAGESYNSPPTFISAILLHFV